MIAKIISSKKKEEASEKALELLLKKVDKDTLLLLSGGTSPDILYKLISRSLLCPGGIALVDERFGLLMHSSSNEKMILDTGLRDHIINEGISFYGILTGNDMETTARQYEQTIINLFQKFPKRIAVMGIGVDGHTAGIKPNLEYDHSRSVVAYDDLNGSFGKRVTLTFEALNQIKEFIILVFGRSKESALRKMFAREDQKQLPAVFFRKTSAKATLLTDLNLSSILKE